MEIVDKKIAILKTANLNEEQANALALIEDYIKGRHEIDDFLKMIDNSNPESDCEDALDKILDYLYYCGEKTYSKATLISLVCCLGNAIAQYFYCTCSNDGRADFLRLLRDELNDEIIRERKD